MPKFKEISWAEYGRLASELARKIQAGRVRFNLVIGVARGGIPVAMVVSDHLNVKIDIINVKSYSGIGKREAPRILSTLTETIKGKSVLLVDDLVDQGDTMRTITSHLSKEKPRKLQTAVLIKKPWSKFEPDYYLQVHEEWIVFPYEKGEVGRLREQSAARSIAPVR